MTRLLKAILARAAWAGRLATAPGQDSDVDPVLELGPDFGLDFDPGLESGLDFDFDPDLDLDPGLYLELDADHDAGFVF